MQRGVRRQIIALATVALVTIGHHGLSVAEEMRTANDVLSAIKQHGANAVARELWESGAWEKYLYPGVKSADPGWLKVARAIRPGTDAGASEELSDAIAIALLKRPSLVLPVARDAWWTNGEKICLFGVDSELPGGARAYVRKLERTLKREQCSASCELRTECLSNLAESKRIMGAKAR